MAGTGDHKGTTIRHAIETVEQFIEDNPTGLVSIRLDQNHAEPEASLWSGEKLKDGVYYAIGPLLPEREHTLNVRLRNGDGYDPVAVARVDEKGLPGWTDEFREASIQQYRAEKEGTKLGRAFFWPDSLAEWDTDDVDQWWDDEEFGIRAVAVNTRDLLVQDLKAKHPEPQFQPTSSWTRGVQFVLA